jgi:hypothetical protein
MAQGSNATSSATAEQLEGRLLGRTTADEHRLEGRRLAPVEAQVLRPTQVYLMPRRCLHQLRQHRADIWISSNLCATPNSNAHRRSSLIAYIADMLIDGL